MHRFKVCNNINEGFGIYIHIQLVITTVELSKVDHQWDWPKQST